MKNIVKPQDAVVLQVIARELEGLAGQTADAAGRLLAMAAELIRTVETGGVDLAPAPDRGIDVMRLGVLLIEQGVIPRGATLTSQRSELGFSKDTYLVRVEHPEQEPWVLVVRRDLPAGPSRTTVLDEYPLLKAVHRAGLPVAEPLLFEENPDVLGRPFLISRWEPGSPNVTTTEQDRAKRTTVAGDLANFLARLHTLPTGDLPIRRLAPGQGAHAELAAHFREWRGFWQECGPTSLDWINDAYHMLESYIPPLDRLALIHSDVGFHNILVHEGRITAVLDWEFSHLGEPEEDLAYARPSIEALTSWENFLDSYAAAGGPAVSPERVRAYEIWKGVRNATCCALGLRAFENGLNTDMRLAYAGRILLQQFASDVAHQLERAA